MAEKVTLAYCLELKEVVSITEARRAYFSQPEPRRRYTFLCANQDCLAMKSPPKITGVNYSSLPEDTYKAAHFRDPKESHAPNCPWQTEEGGSNSSGRPETEAEARVREMKRKLHDYIDEFDPTPPIEGVKPTQSKGVTGLPNAEGRTTRAVPKADYYSSRNRTSNFDRLVEFYRNAYQELTSEEFFSMRLKVKGEGVIPLSAYFPMLSKAIPGQANRVIHGGAKLEPRKGTGFMLWFYDRVEGKAVYLSVSAKQLAEYRHKGFINDTLGQADADYFTVFALGRLVLSETGKTYRLVVDHLKNLTLFAAKRKARVTNETPAV